MSAVQDVSEDIDVAAAMAALGAAAKTAAHALAHSSGEQRNMALRAAANTILSLSPEQAGNFLRNVEQRKAAATTKLS